MAAGEEFRFKIDAYSPETMPMARLAECLAQLAIILGELNAVHLVRLEGGSTIVVHKIEREAVPKVVDRVTSVRVGDRPPSMPFGQIAGSISFCERIMLSAC